MGSRLVLILDDLLWVLTDSQLKAALHFLDSLTGLVQKATEVTRIKKAARKLEVILIIMLGLVDCVINPCCKCQHCKIIQLF
jgi:hypothetical protein